MKLHGLILVGALLIGSIATANTQYHYGYECSADGKAVVLKYSYSGGYFIVDSLTVDGQDFTTASSVSVTRGSGTIFTIRNYRSGKSMSFVIASSGDYYQLEGGSQYPMNCKTILQPAAPAADDRL